MQSSSNKRIDVELHLKKHQKPSVSVFISDKINILQSHASNSDFYYNGNKLDTNKTFQEEGINKSCIVHTYQKNKSMIHFNPIFFKFFNGSVSEMNVPIIWTFKRAVQALGASSGINPQSISLIFSGRRLIPQRAFIDETGMQKQTTLHVIINQGQS